MDNRKKAHKIGISLFCSSGIGDLGLQANDIDVVVANELIGERAQLFLNNYPNAKMFNEDIWQCKDKIVKYYKENFLENPYVILATPPCQGMSSNGMGKMLSDLRKGIRKEFDSRNQLIIPAIDIINELQPEWVIFENVPNMNNTIILDKNGQPINIIEYIFQNLKGYVGRPEVVNTADYGIPQIRKRLITILSRTESAKAYFNKNNSFLPDTTHNENGDSSHKKWLTLRDAIGNLPPLDAIEGKNDRTDFNQFHRVPIMDPKKYEWIRNTKEGDTAFNNQCINPNCMYQGNTKHGTKYVDGINKFKTETPLYCEKCGSLLPRPSTVDKKTGKLRIMKGFTSAYKRMNWDIPASTLTMNFPYVSSDNKVHPSQNRTLSIYEAMVLQTISEYNFSFIDGDKYVSDSLVIESIGESVPPRLIDLIIRNIKNI